MGLKNFFKKNRVILGTRSGIPVWTSRDGGRQCHILNSPGVIARGRAGEEDFYRS
jgi:hypothetical protein